MLEKKKIDQNQKSSPNGTALPYLGKLKKVTTYELGQLVNLAHGTTTHLPHALPEVQLCRVVKDEGGL